MLKLYLSSALIISTHLLMSMNAAAQPISVNPPSIRAGLSGFWFNPDQPAHGVQLEILNNGRALVSWFTYYRNGAPLWLIGEGVVEGNQIKSELLTFTGGRPPAHWSDGAASSKIWGTVTLTIQGCLQGVLNWTSADPDFGHGELPLTRLTTLQGTSCFAEEQFSQQFIYSFERGAVDFTPVFADLPADYDPNSYELDFRHEQLPAPLWGYSGLRLTGHNRSDDLAMLIKSPIRGLQPSTVYRVEIDAEIASNVPQGCFGVGGSPGEGVYVKLGAVGIEPNAVIDSSDNWLRLNIDYGNQSESGAHARVVGNLANSQQCDAGANVLWELKRVSTEGQKIFAQTDENGTLWVFAGTDSAFEGLTQYYLTTLRIRVESIEPSLP